MLDECLQIVVDGVKAYPVSNLPDGFVEDVVRRLDVLGCHPVESDVWLIAYCIASVERHVLIETNQPKIPDGLHSIAVDMASGEVLNTKYLSGNLDISGLDVSGMVETVKQGDTSVTFAAEGSDQVKLTALLQWLRTGREGDLICYRRLRW